MASRFQKVALTITVAGCLVGIGFQHYVRGPRQRLERIEAALQSNNWGALANCYSTEDWSAALWTKSQMISFAKMYVEPCLSSEPRLKHSNAMFVSIPVRDVSLLNPAGKSVVSVQQGQTAKLLWSSSSMQIFIPLGWKEECPSLLGWIRQVSQIKYPHPEVKDRYQAGAVSEFEFLLAEKSKLQQMGLNVLISGLSIRPAKTIDDYLTNQRRAYRKVWEPFAKIEAKYSIKK